MSTVSLIIPNYNGKHFLEPCLFSIMSSDWIKLLFDPFIQKRKLKRRNIAI